MNSSVQSPEMGGGSIDGPGSALDVRIHQDESQVIVSVTGELDVATAPRFAEAMISAGANDPPLVVVDTGALSFVDARGLSALLAARLRSRSRSGDLVIRNPPSMLRKMLRITELTSLIE